VSRRSAEFLFAAWVTAILIGTLVVGILVVLGVVGFVGSVLYFGCVMVSFAVWLVVWVWQWYLSEWR
jgi:uncharacterized membrane protein YphA (DoxX/SURF4 family)